MATIRLISLLMFIVFALCTLRTRIGVGASPTINTASPPKPHDITGKIESGPQANNNQQEQVTTDLSTTVPNVSSASSSQIKSHGQPASSSKHLRVNNAEKLKRGLTNFMNHLNPAPYFVPTQLAGTSSNGKTATAGSQAEPATIINDGPSADVLIKGPNRLVQARPLGGPLRWGRR